VFISNIVCSETTKRALSSRLSSLSSLFLIWFDLIWFDLGGSSTLCNEEIISLSSSYLPSRSPKRQFVFFFFFFKKKKPIYFFFCRKKKKKKMIFFFWWVNEDNWTLVCVGLLLGSAVVIWTELRLLSVRQVRVPPIRQRNKVFFDWSHGSPSQEVEWCSGLWREDGVGQLIIFRDSQFLKDINNNNKPCHWCQTVATHRTVVVLYWDWR